MNVPSDPRNFLRRRLTGGLLLGVFLLLNAAVVLPAFHALWHDDHSCDETECVVLAVAQGKLDPPEVVLPPLRPVALGRVMEWPALISAAFPQVGSPPSERGPPV